jgi:hypothetical protein
MLEDLMQLYIMMAIVWMIYFFRNYIFRFVYALFGKSIQYVKNSKVDLGLSIMIFSITAGITIVIIFPSISVDLALFLIVLPCCVGAVVAALGLQDERRANKKDK